MRRSWNTKEAKIAYEWARVPEEQRRPIVEVSKELGRTPKAILNFLRRQMPPEDRPWGEKARWRADEAAEAKLALEWASIPEDERPSIDELSKQIGRTPKAILNFLRRHLPRGQRPWAERPCWRTTDQTEGEGPKYTIPGLAEALGVSRRTVYRWIAEGYLRRWKGGVSEASFVRLVREHPEIIPYARLAGAREWLVLNGVPELALKPKAPSTNNGAKARPAD